MTTRVDRLGESLAIRIPGAYAEELDLAEGMDLEVTRVEGGWLLSPRKREYTLEELLEQITPENIHGETDWGTSVGGEAW